jgi:hypothetical protein
MSAGSSKRRQLLQAAAAVTHWALAALAPEPMVTAAALTEPPKRAGTDPMRTALSKSKPPTGRRLMQLLSESHLAQSLVRAYICAEQRGEKVSVKAQILAPLTTQYSLRVFNECFVATLNAGGCGLLTRHVWRFGKWHEFTWGAGTTPAVSQTEKWRIKGVVELCALPHPKLVCAVEFIVDNLQHTAFGTHRVRLSNGTWIELPAAELTQCKEALWKLYSKEMENREHISRSQFLELAGLVASATQKSYDRRDLQRGEALGRLGTRAHEGGGHGGIGCPVPRARVLWRRSWPAALQPAARARRSQAQGSILASRASAGCSCSTQPSSRATLASPKLT